MEILSSAQRLVLLEYMGVIRYQPANWLIAEIKLTDSGAQNLTSADVADILKNLFGKYEGRVLICNSAEVLMLIEWGKDNSPQKLTKEVRGMLLDGYCEMIVAPTTKEGLKKIKLLIAPATPTDGPYYIARVARQANIILIVDDDMYIRSVAKQGLKAIGTIVEISDSAQVADAYKTHNPDMVLLDIHMPGLTGQEILSQLKALDPKAHIIMLSADSSVENVQLAHQHGAKGFLTKPFNKTKLMEYVDACPTIN